MQLQIKGLLIATVACLCSGCGPREAPFDPGQYEADTLRWRAERLQRLRGADGYLNLAGLYWLQEGDNSIGSAAGNDVRLPERAAARVGLLQVTDAGVVMVAEGGVDVRYEDVPVRSVLIADDTTDHPVSITHGSLVWTVIKRDNRYALRLRDYEHPAIAAFPPLQYYPTDPALRITGRLHRYDQPKTLNVETVIEGLGWNPESPGVVAFDIDGQMYELEAYASGDQLFFVFGDQTSGRETYPAGRFLYADLPAAGDTTILDFNRAYNPPCAFNDFATCPVASPQNRLAVRIEAGEKYDPEVHSTPDQHF